MSARNYQIQGEARDLVGARAVACPMHVFHASPDLGWSRQASFGLGTTNKPGAPPRPTSVLAT